MVFVKQSTNEQWVLARGTHDARPALRGDRMPHTVFGGVDIRDTVHTVRGARAMLGAGNRKTLHYIAMVGDTRRRHKQLPLSRVRFPTLRTPKECPQAAAHQAGPLRKERPPSRPLSLKCMILSAPICHPPCDQFDGLWDGAFGVEGCTVPLVRGTPAVRSYRRQGWLWTPSACGTSVGSGATPDTSGASLPCGVLRGARPQGWSAHPLRLPRPCLRWSRQVTHTRRVCFVTHVTYGSFRATPPFGAVANGQNTPTSSYGGAGAGCPEAETGTSPIMGEWSSSSS